MRLHFVLLGTLGALVVGAATGGAAETIDRHALVTRHNPVIRSVDFDAPLTVGNGNFAFSVGATGLQDFTALYHRSGIPLETLSRWAWATRANPHNYTLEDASREFVQADGRTVEYPTRQSTDAGMWLRMNPHNQPMGQILLDYTKADGSPLTPDDIGNIEQTLDMWTGIITSRYEIEGVPVVVTTVGDPERDIVGLRIESDLVESGRLGVGIRFPRGHDMSVKNTPGLDWSDDDAHESRLVDNHTVTRSVDSLDYVVTSDREFQRRGPHAFDVVKARNGRTLELTVEFALNPPETGRSFRDVMTASREHWKHFWENSAAVDFSGSTNPLAAKVEERIVLSRYLMRTQMAGDVPPQESGLTCSTWYGKHHTEMIWWHAAHFPLWGNDALLETNLEWYISQLPAARALARSRGLSGARWAKMTGPEMRESPGGNPLIVWNQPHMVYLCELLYRNTPTEETLTKYRDLVVETAECMASMVHFEESRGEYVLGPPLWIAQEIHDQATSQNPSFELSYWRWALEVAQQWRERLALGRVEKWDHVIAHLPALPQKDGKYVALESHPDTWENIDSRHDHPEMLMPLGFLPGGPDVDRATMQRTLEAVLQQWDWETKIWGWDYPMIAMTAARLGRPETAVEILMRDGPNNVYLPTGHCPQRSDVALDRDAPPGIPRREIAVYMPANGAFLSAVALMIAGWDGSEREFPGFPRDGTWSIRAEGLRPLP